MPDWEYVSTSCRQGSITETWRIYCSDDDESVCKSLGCHAILNDLVSKSAGSGPAHGDRSNPGLTGPSVGLGYPYENRPCDLNDPLGTLFLGIPEIDGNVESRGDRCCKTVRLTWKPRSDGQSEIPQDNDDPNQETDQWCPQISSSSVERIEAAQTMVFGGIWQATDGVQNGGCCVDDAGGQTLNNMLVCGGAGAGGRTLEMGKCYTPQASNGQPYPALDRRAYDRAYRVKIFRACKPNGSGGYEPFDESSFDGWEGVANCNQFTLTFACRCWQRTFPPRTLLIANVSTDPQFVEFTNPLTGVKLDYPIMCVTFDLIYRAETWDIDLLDAGTLHCPDAGGTPANPNACLEQEVITDPQGFATDHEVPLNGSGECLPIDEAEWYTNWRAKCRDFDNTLPTLGTYITT